MKFNNLVTHKINSNENSSIVSKSPGPGQKVHQIRNQIHNNERGTDEGHHQKVEELFYWNGQLGWTPALGLYL